MRAYEYNAVSREEMYDFVELEGAILEWPEATGSRYAIARATYDHAAEKIQRFLESFIGFGVNPLPYLMAYFPRLDWRSAHYPPAKGEVLALDELKDFIETSDYIWRAGDQSNVWVSGTVRDVQHQVNGKYIANPVLAREWKINTRDERGFALDREQLTHLRKTASVFGSSISPLAAVYLKYGEIFRV